LEEADQLADRIAIIDNGKIVSQGTPDELKAQLGETTFEIVLADHSQAQQAADVAQFVTQEKPVLSPERGTLTTNLGETKLMTKLLVSLEEQQIEVLEFSVRKPTLDEVFLETTKKEA
jgi:ABC-2 type transport system ATP-binding protein